MTRWEDEAHEVFEAWADDRASDPRRPLGPASAAKYRATWLAWVRHLAGTRRSWMTATPADLEAFVAEIAPRSARLDAPSPVSRARYWRTIANVYDFTRWQSVAAGRSVRRGTLLHEVHRLRPPEHARSEAAESSVISAQHWQALLAAKVEGPAWPALRDRAMLLVELDTALTVAELRALKVGDVSWLARKPALATLQVDGRRRAQSRELQLGALASRTLRRWLDVRATLPAVDDCVFVSRKGLRSPSTVAIWHALARQVQLALASCGDMDWHHAGPTVLRNAVLLRWLSKGRRPAEVARLAGLGSIRKLERLLSHCDEATRDRLREAVANEARARQA